MLIYEHEGKDYIIRNLAKELNLKELSHITMLSESDGHFFEKWLKIVEFLGGKDLADIMSMNALMDFVRNFKATDFDGEILESIDVEGFKYIYSKELNAKDIATLEGFINEKKDKVKYIFATVFKRSDLSNKEHYSAAHIEHKVKLFEGVISAEIANPVIIQVSKQIIESISQVANESN